MSSSRVRAAVVTCCLALAACGGGGGGAAPPAAATSGGGAALGKASFSFFIPSASRATTQGKRPNYLPATTQSLVLVVINPDGSPFGLPVVTNVNATNCPAVTGGLQCNVTASVPQGPVVISAIAYASANGAGIPLSAGYAATTIASGTSVISITLSGAAAYIATSLGGGLSVVAVDHQRNLITVSKVGGTTGMTGTLAPLPNGFDKITVTASTGGTPNGTVAYFREYPNGGGFFISKGLATNSDGSSTQGDWGVATALQPCGSVTGTLAYNLLTIAGPAFSVAASTNEAYESGTATVTSTSLSATGTSYAFNGTNLGASTNANGQTCAGGIFSSTTNDTGAFDSQGAIVAANGNVTLATAADVGHMGFFAPAQPYSLNALASVPYDGAIGGSSVSNGATSQSESPGVLMPAGGTTLNVCKYSDFENNIVDTTTCSPLTLTGQPFPGIVTGTMTISSGNGTFVAAVGHVDGKYMIEGIGVDSVSGQATNLVLLQQ